MIDFDDAIKVHLSLIRGHKSCNEREVNFVVDRYKDDKPVLFSKLIEMEDNFARIDLGEIGKDIWE